MDITSLRIIVTITTFVTFVGIWLWAWLRSNQKDFDEAANLPFEGEE